MGRANPSLNLTNFPTVGATIATDFRAAIAGGILGTWTVSALYTMAGVRDYFILSAGSVEILCQLNNGTTSHYNSVWVNKRASSDYTRTPVFWLAPDGGFIAAFGAALDPVDQAFWDYITVTLGNREPSQGYQMDRMTNANTNVKLYTVVDDTTNMIAIYIGGRTGDARYQCLIFADDFINTTSIDTVRAPGAEAVVWVSLQDSASPPLPYLGFSLWDENGALVVSSILDNDEVQGFLNSLSAASITARGTIPTTPFVFKTPTRFYAKSNPAYLRVAPYNDPTAYKDDAGTDADEGWIRLHRYLLEPWEQGASNPT